MHRTARVASATHGSLIEPYIIYIHSAGESEVPATRKLSLRDRLLWPLLAVSAAAAVVVAVLSSWVGRQWAIRDVQDRFDAIEQTIQPANFPLTASVVASLAKLSGTELLAFDDQGNLLSSTLSFPLDPDTCETLEGRAGRIATAADTHKLGPSRYLALSFHRPPTQLRADQASKVIVLFDEARVESAGRRAALLPLVTGISTIFLLATLMTIMTGRLAVRLAKLQRGLEKVADGDFESLVADSSTDEVGRLGQSVDKMAAQLKQLWLEVNRQQSQKLLHQIAGGMAHQLRNTLTGARLALELHRQNCPGTDQQEVNVALRQLEDAEDYVRRLLLVGTGEKQKKQVANLLTCLNDVRASHSAIAQHLRIHVDWELQQITENFEIEDGATFTSAISNLVLNGLEAAGKVQVRAAILDLSTCVVSVTDDGPGIEPAVAKQLFEPFVTTKPEGLGLGLPLVRRAAEALQGQVEWRRENSRTIFEFRCHVTPKATPCQT